MKKILLFAAFLLFFLIPTTTFAIVERIPKTQEPQFVANEIIVKYKPNQSPNELAIMLEKKLIRKKTIVGFFQVFFADVSLRLHKQETLEAQIKRLGETDKKAGVVAKKQLFPNPPPELANIFLLTLKSNNAQEAIQIYKSLPEVAYAELNQIVHIMQ